MYQIEVENIKCGGCANTIEKAMLKVKNVDQVKINLENNTIVIIGEANRIEIITRLAELGYPEKGNNSILCKAKSYLSCAIGKMN